VGGKQNRPLLFAIAMVKQNEKEAEAYSSYGIYPYSCSEPGIFLRPLPQDILQNIPVSEQATWLYKAFTNLIMHL
jgi:hypothetical protein